MQAPDAIIDQDDLWVMMEDDTQEMVEGMAAICPMPNCVRIGQGGMVRKQVLAINKEEEMVKYDAETKVELDENRQRGRVIGPMIARRMSLFGEDMDISTDQVVDVIPAKETKVVGEEPELEEKELVREVLVARRKRIGQRKEPGVKVRRINDLFKVKAAGSLRVNFKFEDNTNKKRKQLDGEKEDLVVRKRIPKGQ